MITRTRSEQLAVAGGIALVVMGVFLLLGRWAEPLLWPLTQLAHAVSAVAWPVALIALGAVLLGRARRDESPGAQPASGTRRLLRSRTDRVATGLLGGAAAYLGVPAGLVRVIFVVLTLMAGAWWGLVVYAVATVLVPEAPATMTMTYAAPQVP